MWHHQWNMFTSKLYTWMAGGILYNRLFFISLFGVINPAFFFMYVIHVYMLTECHPRHYGLECKSNCVGHCKENDPRNHTTGLCYNGCFDGWTGKNCTEC